MRHSPSIFSILLLLLIVVPIIEIALFIQAGSLIGFWPTIGLILLTAVIGTSLLHIQGREAMLRAKEAIQKNQLPAACVLESVILLICYLLLLTPGFFTDAIGFILIIPASRRVLMKLAFKTTAKHGFNTSAANDDTTSSSPSSNTSSDPNEKIIEGEFRDL